MCARRARGASASTAKAPARPSQNPTRLGAWGSELCLLQSLTSLRRDQRAIARTNVLGKSVRVGRALPDHNSARRRLASHVVRPMKDDIQAAIEFVVPRLRHRHADNLAAGHRILFGRILRARDEDAAAGRASALVTNDGLVSRTESSRPRGAYRIVEPSRDQTGLMASVAI